MSLSQHSPDALIDRLTHDLGVTKEKLAVAQQRLNAFIRTQTEPPKWLSAVPKSKVDHHGTAVLMLSDLHFDEVVDLHEMSGVNKYDRDIAEQRLERVGRKTINVLRDYWTGTIYDGIVVILGGDVFSGTIHDELRESNADTMPSSIRHWTPQLMQLLVRLADEFGKVHVVVVPGNHGRNTPKKRHKHHVRDNWDWFIGAQLQWVLSEVVKDDRITFDVSEATETTFDVYGWKVLALHGDEASGGHGIGGIWPPIMRMISKKQSAYAAIRRDFDFAAMGHWHQLTWGPGDSWMINGSLKGWDEFARHMNFAPEIAQQGLWVMSPERKITWRTGIQVEDREAEGW